jgi:thermostable 8-oxoguanine DNA glycosylase
MNEKADDLSMGGASSFDEYQRMVGVIEGLAIAEREILDLMEKQRRAEDGSDG